MHGNLIIENLKIISSRYKFSEKILICPTFAIGHQILENLTREYSGFSWINFKVKTILALAEEIAEEEIYEKNLKKISFLETNFIIDEIFMDLAENARLKYFEKLLINTGIINAISGAIIELKFAGVDAGDLDDNFFINKNKAHDIKLIYKLYDEKLKSRYLADSPDIINIAVKKLNRINFSLEEFNSIKTINEASKHSLNIISDIDRSKVFIIFARYNIEKIEKDFIKLLCGQDLIVIGEKKVFGFKRPQKRLIPSDSF